MEEESKNLKKLEELVNNKDTEAILKKIEEMQSFYSSKKTKELFSSVLAENPPEPGAHYKENNKIFDIKEAISRYFGRYQTTVLLGQEEGNNLKQKALSSYKETDSVAVLKEYDKVIHL